MFNAVFCYFGYGLAEGNREPEEKNERREGLTLSPCKAEQSQTKQLSLHAACPFGPLVSALVATWPRGLASAHCLLG